MDAFRGRLDAMELQGFKTIIEADDIQRRVREMAGDISSDYAGSSPLFIVLLKGAFIFAADLIRNLSIPHEIDFITLFSYQNGTKRSADVGVINHIRSHIEDRDIIIVDEIVDTGHTLSRLIRTLKDHNARTHRICTLLDKPEAREVRIEVDYVGFTIPDVFVVGYGLDYRERYRNLPFIAELTPEIKNTIKS
jgi:hypoxanthine phosphoribosyltransferase